MRRYLFNALVSMALFLGIGQAQNTFFSGGAQGTLLNGSLLFGSQLQLGVDNLIGKNIGFKVNADLIFIPGFDLGIGLDLYYRLPSEGLTSYFGVGTTLYPFGSVFAINAHALAGFEFRASQAWRFYLEATPGLIFAGGNSSFQAGLAFGSRIRF
jgi:hypothetical protein